jgi:hypothetical protein
LAIEQIQAVLAVGDRPATTRHWSVSGSWCGLTLRRHHARAPTNSPQARLGTPSCPAAEWCVSLRVSWARSWTWPFPLEPGPRTI